MLDEFGDERLGAHNRMRRRDGERQEHVLRQNKDRWEKERMDAVGSLFPPIASMLAFGATVAGGLWVCGLVDLKPAKDPGKAKSNAGAESWTASVRPEGKKQLKPAEIADNAVAETHVKKVTAEVAPVNVNQITP